MRILIVYIFITVLNFNLGAQALKYSNDFLAIGVGARAAAMGNSVIASTNDVLSGYWNPAGLMQINDHIQIAAMHNEQFAGVTKFDYGAVAFGLNQNSKAAVSFVRLGVDGIPNTLYLMQDGQINYALIKTFSAADYAITVSYAKNTKIQGLSIGANTKVIRRVVGDFGGAWGFGLDAGAQYQYKKWHLALMARDITGTFNAWSFNLSDEDKKQLALSGNAAPTGGLELTLPRFTLGAARKFSVWKDQISILPELNFDLTTDGQRNVLISSKLINIDPRAGIEIGYKNFAFIRGGVNNLQYIRDFAGAKNLNLMPSIGVGLKLNAVSIDYALGNAFNEGLLGMSNIISLRLSLNPKK